MKKILVDAHDWFPYTGCMITMLSWMRHDVKIPMRMPCRAVPRGNG
jgi:hypothetical protein